MSAEERLSKEPTVEILHVVKTAGKAHGKGVVIDEADPQVIAAYLVERLGQDGAAKALGMEPWDGSMSWWYFPASETPCPYGKNGYTPAEDDTHEAYLHRSNQCSCGASETP